MEQNNMNSIFITRDDDIDEFKEKIKKAKNNNELQEIIQKLENRLDKENKNKNTKNVDKIIQILDETLDKTKLSKKKKGEIRKARISRILSQNIKSSWNNMLIDNIKYWFDIKKNKLYAKQNIMDDLEQKKARLNLIIIILFQIIINIAYGYIIFLYGSSIKNYVAAFLIAYVGIKILAVILNALKIYGDCSCTDNDNIDLRSHLDNILICIPAYNEGSEAFLKTINSIVSSTFPLSKMHIYFIIDGRKNGCFDNLMKVITNDNNFHFEIPEKEYYLTQGIYESSFPENKGKRINYTVLVKPNNEGKRDSQRIFIQTLRYSIDNIKPKYTLFIDSDTAFDKKAIKYLYDKMENNENAVGVCGQLKLSNPILNLKELKKGDKSDIFYYFSTIFVVGFQYYEYHYNQVISKQFESLFGSVTCLPGAFTLFRSEMLVNIEAKYTNTYQNSTNSSEENQHNIQIDANKLYINEQGETNLQSDFFSKDVKDLVKRNLYELGEDRTLTVRFLENGYSTLYEPRAIAYTDCPDNIVQLTMQRRRWNNSTLVNLINMVLSPKLWFQKKMLLVMIFTLIDLVGTFILTANSLLLLYLIWDPFFAWVGVSKFFETGYILLMWLLFSLIVMLSAKIETSSLYYIFSTFFTSVLMLFSLYFFFSDNIIPIVSDFIDDPAQNWALFAIIFAFLLLNLLVSVFKPWAFLSSIFPYILFPTINVTIPFYSILHIDDFTWGTR